MPRRTDSREKLIATARRLFLEKGYPATSLNDVAAGAGVTKGSFFHHFDSKEELGLEVLVTDFEATADALVDGPFSRVQSPVERALAFIDHTDRIAERVWGHGSLLGGFASSLAATSPRIRSVVARSFERLADGIAPIFEPLANLSVRKVSGEELSRQFLAVIEGGATLARAHDDPAYLHGAIRGFRHTVELLIRERR